MSSDAASATSLAETSASRYWVTATSPNITTVVEGPASPFEPSSCTHHRVHPAAHLDQGPPPAWWYSWKLVRLGPGINPHEDTVSCCIDMTWYTISKRATTRQILHTTRGAAEAKSSSCTSIDHLKHGKILADVLYTLYWWSETKKKKKKKKIDNYHSKRLPKPSTGS